jgi:hypothetical protein
MSKLRRRSPNALEFFPALWLGLGISRLEASATGSELKNRHGAGTSARAKCGGESDVVDFGIGAPHGAAGDGDFEFAREIIELGIAREFLVESQDHGGDVRNFVGVESGEGAPSDVAYDVATSASGAEAHGLKALEDFGKRFEFEPVKLDVLANGDVGDTVATFIGKGSDGAELDRGE